MSTVDIALDYHARGLTVIPIEHGSKKPTVPWKAYQHHRPNESLIRQWFEGTDNNVALPPDTAAGFLDVLHQVGRFKGRGQARTPWLDLEPPAPDHDVSFLDMLQGVSGFKDVPYPWDDPCTCAGLAPCP